MMIMLWSAAALLTGFILDCLFGDPYNFPHIVRWLGRLIAVFEKLLRRALPSAERGETLGGALLAGSIMLISAGGSFAALFFCYRLSPPLGYILESALCYQLLAARALKTESMKVYHSLLANDVEGARKNISMIVGRDTSVLTQDEITRAAVETVAENAADGVVSPLLYIMLGGAPLGCLYKAVNTMDSMVGYKTTRYICFGRAAAKIDDVLSYIPSRLCALLIIAASYLLRFDGKSAYRIWRRDKRSHASPNSAQTEAACAGALGIRLAGPAVYFGNITDKPYIGNNTRPVQANDIVNANRLMYTASGLMLIIALLFRTVCLGVVWYGAL